MLEPTSGTIWLDGVDITKVAPHRRVRRGIVRTFQINQFFSELTALKELGASEAIGPRTSTDVTLPMRQ